MSSSLRILERLPAVYRPEPGYDDNDLLLQLVASIGELLDYLSETSAEVMQSHWYDYADNGLYSNWLSRRRLLNGEPPAKPGDEIITQHPYLFDLPRVASLLDMGPWREPLRDRENVEAFRLRIQRIVQLHKEGLGTLAALRNMTLASLPQIDAEAPEGLRERNFTVEEFSGGREARQAATSEGPNQDLVGPLMRWQIDSQSLTPVSPMLIIQGVEPEAERIDPTDNPIIERFDPETGTGIGIHYQGALAAGEALAIVLGYSAWLGQESGILLANAIPESIEPVNPTAAGPWSLDNGVPSDQIVDIQQSQDHFLWAAVNADTGSLWRFDGETWTEVLSDLPEIRCLLANGAELLVGFSTGLSRLEIQPLGDFVLAPDPATLSDPAVHALAADASGIIWAATDQGLASEQNVVLIYTELGNRTDTETPLHCLWLDASGDIYCGGQLGLFLYRPSQQRWYILQDEAVDEAIDDWLQLDLLNSTLPEPESIFVPPIHAIAHGADTDIWLGTAQGIARYRAREQRRTYTTLLEAFPQLTESRVSQIKFDARGRLWFATDNGLFIYDQLDWFQLQGDELHRLPREIEEQERPVFWRYVRDSNQWQFLAPPDSGGFQGYSGPQLGSNEAAVLSIQWTTSAHARPGSFDGEIFSIDENLTPAPLLMRYKSEATRIVDGGITAMPAMPPGDSHWRYLQREEAAVSPPGSFPAWTRESRLLPPPDKAEAPFEGRYLSGEQGPDQQVFSFCPAAKVWFSWQPYSPLQVTVRLSTAGADEVIDPAILDRVWNALQRVKPAAVAVYLAVNETIERGL